MGLAEKGELAKLMLNQEILVYEMLEKPGNKLRWFLCGQSVADSALETLLVKDAVQSSAKFRSRQRKHLHMPLDASFLIGIGALARTTKLGPRELD